MKSQVVGIMLAAASLLPSFGLADVSKSSIGSSALPEPPAAVAGGASSGLGVGAKTADEWHEAGVRLLRERQLDAAVQSLRHAVVLDDRSALYVTDLGYAYLKQRRLLEAEAAFKQGIELDPLRFHAYEHLEQSITQQPERWEKRQELLRILEQGLDVNRDRETRLRIDLARIRAERSFGLVERARGHIESLLRQPKLSRPIERQLLDLKASIEQDKKARALRDWPEPLIEQRDQERLAACANKLGPEDRRATLATVAELLAKYPAWRAPRWLRANRFAEQGNYDEAVKELTVLTRLAPSDPRYHRQLGVLLAEHGGLLEIERADEALRVALALEPEWSELEQMRQTLAARRYDSPAVNGQLGHAAPPPTENAVRLYGEAESSLELDPTNQQAAKDLVEQALRESPSYVEAAALLFTLNRRVHEATVTALWNDASGLFSLYREFSRLEPSVPRPTLDGWLNRAIELGSVEGRMSRALGKKNHGDVAAAEVELSNYLALVSNREDVEAVQTLRTELKDRKHERGTEHDLLLNARLRLQRDDVEGALAILEAPCSASMGPERFLAIGTVYERQGKGQRALDCYELALAEAARNEGTRNVETQLEWTQQEWTQKITRRATRLLARAEVNLFEHPFARRLVELSATQPAALWALARHALARGKSEEAERYAARYLASAAPEDRFVRDARVLERQLAQKAQAQLAGERRQHRQLQGIGLVALAVLGLGSYLVLFRGSTVARAIRRRARLFPELSRIVGELRHDVFKHRTSALELLRDGQTTIEQLRSTLLDPVPTSQVIADAYGRLVSLARAQGIRLRRLQREPVFGRLVRELYAMERALAGTGDRATILAVDTRLRTTHKLRLDGLLATGPRCHLDAAKIQGWISALQAEYAAKGRPWTVPALQMSDPCLAFPIDESALFQIFANLLRNAEAAVEGMASPQIQVALVHASDFTGQPLVRLEISDNAPGEVREEAIEAQSPGRGLGIVRDTVRDWNGHLVVRQGNEAHRKSVGVEFRQ